MRFLIDEDMPRSTGNLLRQYGHEAVDMRDIGLRSVRVVMSTYWLGMTRK